MKVSNINSKNFSDNDSRLDSSYHLSDGPNTKRVLESSPYQLSTLESECDNLFSGSIFKRTFVADPNFGFPYLTASDMTSSDIENGKYISRKYTDKIDSLRIHKDWILISCSGTLGNVVFTNEDFAGRIGTHDLIRAIPNEQNTLKGFLYAFLASKYGYGLLTQSSYGGVIKHIEPHHIKNIPIPIFPIEQQERINALIADAAKNLETANKLLKEATSYFDNLELNYRYGSNITQKVSVISISNDYKRFDASYAIVSEKVESALTSNNIPFRTIKSQTESIFLGPRSKRTYVNQGKKFLSTSAMQKTNPTRSGKYLSSKSAEGLFVKDGWLLTTRSGTLGDTVFTLPCIDGFAVSDDAIRIVVKEDAEFSSLYIYAFLKSKIGKSSLLSGSFGSVIQHLNESFIGDIKIPVLSEQEMASITDKIRVHNNCWNEAILKENEAINLIEMEIESWQ